MTLSKPHLVYTFYDKQINAKKYEWKLGSVQVLLGGDCIYITLHDYTLTRILHWLVCRDCGFTGFTCINQFSYIIEEPYSL